MERGWKPDAALVLDGSAPRDAVHPAAGLLAKVQSDPDAPMPGRPQLVLPPLPALDRLDGVLALMVEHILATAIRPQPWLAVGASLAVLGALMGRKVRTPTNLRSNLYVLGIAESGGGKDHARKAIKEILVQAGLSHHLGGERLASGAGLITALVRQPAALFQIDEFGRFLANVVDKRRAPKHLSEIWDLFTELATSAGDHFLRRRIRRPEGAAAPGHHRALRLRARRQRTGAILGCAAAPVRWRMAAWRVSWCSAARTTSPIAIVARARCPICRRELLAAVQAVAAVGAGEAAGNLVAIGAPNVRPAPLTVPMDDEALAIFDDLDRGHDPPPARRRRLRAERRARPRVGEHRQGRAGQGGERQSGGARHPRCRCAVGARGCRSLRRDAPDPGRPASRRQRDRALP